MKIKIIKKQQMKIWAHINLLNKEKEKRRLKKKKKE
jgi:hypothetical protein